MCLPPVYLPPSMQFLAISRDQVFKWPGIKWPLDL